MDGLSKKNQWLCDKYIIILGSSKKAEITYQFYVLFPQPFEAKCHHAKKKA